MKINIGQKDSGFNLEAEGTQELILVCVGLGITGYLASKTLNIFETVAKRDDLPKIIQGVKDNVFISLKQNQKNLKRAN